MILVKSRVFSFALSATNDLGERLANVTKSRPHSALSLDGHLSTVKTDETPTVISRQLMRVELLEDLGVDTKCLHLTVMHSRTSACNLTGSTSDELRSEHIELVSRQHLVQELRCVLGHDGQVLSYWYYISQYHNRNNNYE